jgi:hypothetical protein
MRRPALVVTTGIVALAVFTGCTRLARPSHSANGSGAFATGQYRNLFAEAGHASGEITNKINAAFQQLFHGDPATQTVYYAAGTNANGPLAHVTDIKHNDVRTEGLSYGMMIAVHLDKKTEFDALWNWARTWMYHASPSHPAFGYFSWSMTTNGTPKDEMPAPDGEVPAPEATRPMASPHSAEVSEQPPATSPEALAPSRRAVLDDLSTLHRAILREHLLQRVTQTVLEIIEGIRKTRNESEWQV